MKFLVTLILWAYPDPKTTYTDLNMNTEKGIEEFRIRIANKNNGCKPDNVNILYIRELKSSELPDYTGMK